MCVLLLLRHGRERIGSNLKNGKIKFIVLGSPADFAKVTINYIVVGDHKICRSEHVINIGAVFNLAVNMEKQIIKTLQTVWYHLFFISKSRQYLIIEQTKFIIHAPITSHFDQNNSLVIVVSEGLLDNL